MLMSKTYKDENGTTLVVYIFRDKFSEDWFKARSIGKHLEFTNSYEAIMSHVQPEDRKYWSEFDTSHLQELPRNWQTNSLFVNLSGLFQLIFRAKKSSAATAFRKWITSSVLPKIYRDQHFVMPNIDSHNVSKLELELKEARENNLQLNNKVVQLADTLMIVQRELTTVTANVQRQTETMISKMESISQDLVVKPSSDVLLHAFIVHELLDNENGAASNDNEGESMWTTFVFTRCQRRNIAIALKRLKQKSPNSNKIFESKKYVPNAINVLNCVKDWLKMSPEIKFHSHSNRITISTPFSVDKLTNFLENSLCKPPVIF